MTGDALTEAAAIGALFDSGEFGLALASADQTVYFTRGKLAEAIALHKPLCLEFPPLVGMTQRLAGLQTERTAVLSIPRVCVVQKRGDCRKVSIEVHWSRDAGFYTVLIHPAAGAGEEEIARTLKVRRLAEKSINARAAGEWRGEPAGRAPGAAKPPPPALASLTARERDVVRLLVCGHSNKNMARILSLSPKTVEAHRARAMKRLGVKTSVELIKLAVEAGWPEAQG